MSNEDKNNDATLREPGTEADRRPLRFWVRVVDRQLSDAFAAHLREEDIGRREWMLLNVLSNDADDERRVRFMSRTGKYRGKLGRGLAERGWAIRADDGSWSLTDAGRDARDRLKVRVDSDRERIVAAISSEEYARMIAALEAVAGELGWDGTERPSRGRRFNWGHDTRGECRPREHGGVPHPSDRTTGNAHRGFGPGFGARRGDRAGATGDRVRRVERAFERGFGAGFSAANRDRVPGTP